MIINLQLNDGSRIYYLTDADKDSFYLLDDYVYFQHMDSWFEGTSFIMIPCLRADSPDLLVDFVRLLNRRTSDMSDPNDQIILLEDDLDGQFIEFIRKYGYRKDEEIRLFDM